MSERRGLTTCGDTAWTCIEALTEMPEPDPPPAR